MVGRERETIVESNKNNLSIKYYYTDMNAVKLIATFCFASLV